MRFSSIYFYCLTLSFFFSSISALNGKFYFAFLKIHYYVSFFSFFFLYKYKQNGFLNKTKILTWPKKKRYVHGSRHITKGMFLLKKKNKYFT